MEHFPPLKGWVTLSVRTRHLGLQITRYQTSNLKESLGKKEPELQVHALPIGSLEWEQGLYGLGRVEWKPEHWLVYQILAGCPGTMEKPWSKLESPSSQKGLNPMKSSCSVPNSIVVIPEYSESWKTVQPESQLPHTPFLIFPSFSFPLQFGEKVASVCSASSQMASLFWEQKETKEKAIAPVLTDEQ